MDICFERSALMESEQTAITLGFETHSASQQAPSFEKESLKWVVRNSRGEVTAAMTAMLLWDWLYIDELWVADETRGTGLGRQLMEAGEALALAEGLEGIWLWTQSWQAEGFYLRLGYQEFTRFDNFPRGFSRIGLRKTLTTP